MAAASKAMRRSNERSSMDSKRSYDRLGGPENVAIPPRCRPAGSRISSMTTTGPVDESYPNDLATMCYMENQDTYPVALGHVNEFGGLDGRMSSLPSSYRRLRKAKSMFSTKQRAPQQLSYGISSEAYGSPVTSQAGSNDISRPPGTLRRSMSFLRGGREPSRSIRHAKSQDAAIQLARTQFLQARKPSIVTMKPRREHKPFRRSFRTNSGSVMDSPATQFSELSKGSPGIHVKARSFSSSIKKGLKRVLGLSKPPEDTVPEQEQSDHPRFSYESAHDPEYTFGGDHSYYGSPGPENIASPARPPTMRSSNSSESLTSRSRVTSWADSTVANTVTPRKTGDRNPLSIIDENGTPGGQSRRGSPRPNASIDGQRLYSALMRHIGANMNEEDEQIMLGHVKEHRPIPERTSSLHTCHSIRQSPSDESMASPRSFATANGSMISPQRQRSRQSKRHVRQQPRYPLIKENDRFDDTLSLRRQPLDSLFEIGEDSSDESGSIIVDRLRNLDEGNSPSVYSRTTSGDSPPKVADQGPHEKEEPGSAMIYESQRSVYKSPKRAAGSSSAATPTQPSGDWQKWMNNQMASLEFTPTRAHYREEAQIHEDDDQNDINALSLGAPNGKDTVKRSGAPLGLSETGSTNSKVPAQSNFSRPFSRSSSVRSIAPSQKVHGPDNKDIDRGLSLSVRSKNRFQPPESPTPKRDEHQRMSTGRRYPTSRMPISREAKAAQFRSMRGSRDNRRPTDENVKVDNWYMETMGPHRYQDGYSPMSSKKMVDRFLDSRRRQMETEMPDGGGSTGAFI